ncbi:MAG: hypothetical protein AB8B55_24470 [Mariniblastus sp.]
MPRYFYLSALICACLFLSGCSVLKVQPVSERVYTFNDLDQYVDVEHGQSTGFIAKANSLKSRVRQLLPGAPSPAQTYQQTQDAVARSVDYLAKNGMDDVKVRVNQYSPADELRRLRSNKTVSRPMRYTMGLASVARDAILPPALTQTDSFNPYTNTLNINSGNALIAVEQAAIGKDIRDRKIPSLYLLSKNLPGGEIPAIVRTKTEVVDYYSKYGTPSEQKLARQVMLPRMTSQIGGEIGDLIPGTQAGLSLAGRAVGAVVGKVMLR